MFPRIYGEVWYRGLPKQHNKDKVFSRLIHKRLKGVANSNMDTDVYFNVSLEKQRTDEGGVNCEIELSVGPEIWHGKANATNPDQAFRRALKRTHPEWNILERSAIEPNRDNTFYV